MYRPLEILHLWFSFEKYHIFSKCTYKYCFWWQPSARCGWFCAPMPCFYFISGSLPCFGRVSKSVMAFRVAFDLIWLFLSQILSLFHTSAVPDSESVSGPKFFCPCTPCVPAPMPQCGSALRKLHQRQTTTNFHTQGHSTSSIWRYRYQHAHLQILQIRDTNSLCWDLEVLWTLRHAPHIKAVWMGQEEIKGGT